MTLVLKPAEIFEKRHESGRLGLLERYEFWDVKPLGQLIELINGAPFDSNLFNRVESGMPLIRIRDVGKANTETWFSGTYDDKYLVKAGDILVGLDGDFRVAQWDGPEALLNQRVCKLVVDSSVLDKKFMVYHLQGWLDAIWEETSATTVKHLSSKSIQEIPFPCPPLAEQRRIVETLDEQLSRLDKALAALEYADSQTLALRRSILKECLSPQAFEPETGDWQVKTLGEVAQWGSGGTPQAGNPNYYGGTTPWAVIGDLNDGKVASTQKSITEEGLANSSAKLVPAGSILIAMYGSIGKMGIADVQMATNQAIAFALPKEDQVLPQYLFWYLLSQRELFLSQGKGATQQNISQTLLKAWEILLPALDEQSRIVETLDDQLSRLDSSRKSISSQKALLATLRRSILKNAFNGELGNN